MNSARTLASRFRTQRTDRIRVDGLEVLSVFEVERRPGEVVEIVVEDGRTSNEQGFRVAADEPVAASVDGETGHAHIASDMRVDASTVEVIELTASNADGAVPAAEATPQLLRIWNTWLLDGNHHAWLGNSGIIAEDIDVPPGARQRVRLWCSDGLGAATFDDLVLLVTVGQLDA